MSWGGSQGAERASGNVLWWTHLFPRLPLASEASWYELGRVSSGRPLLPDQTHSEAREAQGWIPGPSPTHSPRLHHTVEGQSASWTPA